jgi:hypothetical protein
VIDERSGRQNWFRTVPGRLRSPSKPRHTFTGFAVTRGLDARVPPGMDRRVKPGDDTAKDSKRPGIALVAGEVALRG